MMAMTSAVASMTIILGFLLLLLLPQFQRRFSLLFHLLLLLHLPHLRVVAVQGEQLVVAPTLSDFPTSHDDDLVRVSDGRQPVGNYQSGSLL